MCYYFKKIHLAELCTTGVAKIPEEEARFFNGLIIVCIWSKYFMKGFKTLGWMSINMSLKTFLF